MQLSLELMRLFFDLPGLALCDERLKVGLLAGGGGAVLLDDGALEGRRGIFVDDAERDREAFGRHQDQHRRELAGGRGVGGHARGEVAPRVAVETIQTFISETAGADKNRTWPFPFEPQISLEGNRLKAAFRLANRQIATAMADSADLRGMAATASAVLAGPHSACVAHVGDSRGYAMDVRGGGVPGLRGGSAP